MIPSIAGVLETWEERTKFDNTVGRGSNCTNARKQYGRRTQLSKITPAFERDRHDKNER